MAGCKSPEARVCAGSWGEPERRDDGHNAPFNDLAKFLSEILIGNLAKFQDALKQGLIQTFLDYGANPQATLWVDTVTVESAFTLFASATFKIQWSQRVEEMYFQALRSFMRGGAAFDCDDDSFNASSNSGLEATLLGSMVENRKQPSELFFDRFAQGIDAIEKSTSESHHLFIGQLTQKLMPTFKEASWRLDKYQHLVDRALHIHIQASSQTAYINGATKMVQSNANSIGSTSSENTKRRIGTSEDGLKEQGLKRQKQDTTRKDP
ncbi:hypothetical protein BGZ63DRAFT_429436 [Mariannaea sp. PMI_226]|nr:hypothetical protein BGZ63DRAFT_429436 [Mariannaea sp. PMI_226]